MEPIINLDDPIGKTVGRRKPNPLHVFASEKLSNIAWHKAGFGGLPRGVYRFKTYEEADEWLMRNLVSRRRK